MKQYSNEERSKLNSSLPRYHKGYDIDILLEKSFHKLVTGEERIILNEIIRDYYDKEHKRVAAGDKIGSVNPLIVNGKEIYPSGTMINNPFLESLTNLKNRGND